MWSDKKHVNVIVNILLFMLGINFMHYGQLFLPLICLILFVDNKFKLKLNNNIEFVCLCLFAITFFVFSYKNGFYSTMGFCLPMAYYIGSNLKEKRFNGIKKLIYLIAFAMAFHLVLNLFQELSWWYDDLSYMFNKPSHYDIWIDGHVKTTGMSLNFIPVLSCIYFIVRYEEKRLLKGTGIIIFILSAIFCLAMARRTILVLSFISILLPFVYDLFCVNEKRISKKIILILLCSFVSVSIILILMISGAIQIPEKLMIIHKLQEQGFSSDRLDILLESFKLYPKYLFGGQNISNVVGVQIHDLWGDIYDYAGVIPYLFMIVFSILFIKNILVKIRLNSSKLEKLLFLSILLCMTLVLFLEPIMTGASLYLICLIMIYSAIESINTKL